jgi:hypothetical protein
MNPKKINVGEKMHVELKANREIRNRGHGLDMLIASL